MSISILNTALSGLAAFQRSLETTSNNISNVNTDGYSRQRAEYATRPEQFLGGNYVGTGVQVTNIARSYDQFITGQVRSSNSAFGEVDRFHSLSSQIDNIIAADGTNMAPAIKSFFNAVHEVADDPSSVPARQVMLSEAENMAHNFNTLSARFTEIRDQVNTDMGNMLTDLNSYAKDIADLNVRIVADIARARGEQMPNELLDKRDLLLNKIAKIIDVSVLEQQNGSVSVFIGKGQSLVIGDYAATLSLENSPTDTSRKEIFMDGQNISKQLSGGTLYGSLRFRDEVLEPTQQQLGMLAAGIAVEFNRVHQAGYDLNGVAGGPLFDLDPLNQPDQIPINRNPNNPSAGTVVATYQPGGAASLAPSDYRLDITAAGYTLTRLSDNVSSNGALGGAVTATPFGFDLDLSNAALADGDNFLIRPTYRAAGNIDVVISDPRLVAAATDFVAGPPVAGLPGDNRNALALAQLETSNTMLGGTATFDDTYGQLVSKVGTQTHSADVSRSAQDALLRQATASWESVSGVNLDEEAANLIKFQQSYQAAAQAISVTNTLFDSLIGAVR
ncbi:MAG: flagellar hook-associated protein FlgK [Gammaproteobacteria bacterium]